MNSSKRILVAPLNWGLGHATRCIPIIRELQQQGAEVLLASDGRALQLLREEFQHLPYHTLPAYEITYPFSSMLWSIGWQIPKILRAIKREHAAIDQIIQRERIDAIISDNRFGCFSKKVKTVFLTHQLMIKMPYQWLEKPVNWGNHFWIRQFDECWIPDFFGDHNLSGDLSDYKRNGSRNFKNKGVREDPKFIGILSRMKAGLPTKKYRAIFILSGPEPQRTYLEEKILKQIEKMPERFLIVQGKTEFKSSEVLNNHIEIVSFMTSPQLNQAILDSEIVVSRSGYSTLMDLANLHKKALLIPTPGQTEQEYLANRFFESGIFYCQSQKNLNLTVDLEKAELYPGFSRHNSQNERLKDAVKQLLEG